MSDGVLLAGIGVGGYRSFRETQFLAPLGKVNLLAGQNNVGKSNVVRFITSMLSGGQCAYAWADQPQPGNVEPLLALGYSEAVVEERLRVADPHGQAAGLASRLATSLRGSIGTGAPGASLAWVEYGLPADNGGGSRLSGSWTLRSEYLRRISLGGHIFPSLSSTLTRRSGGAQGEDAARVLQGVLPLTPPPVVTLEAFRRVEDAAEGGNDGHSGRGLIRRLASLQSPSAERSDDRAKFDAINHFLRSVLEDDSVEVDIPSEQDDILVRQNGRRLPLDSLGTGIHEVVILAAAATTLEHTLVCIEEPEVHLHPLLQRKLVRYLAENTSNQYIITTHSAHLLDYDFATVFHLRLTENGTEVRRAGEPHDFAEICHDLGYRPSDLLQTNAVIWVEGPSDRIYVNHWLQSEAPDLVEGIHYSVMFYGGALLNHLTGNDPAVVNGIGEFISLRRLNRHSAIIIDSDKDSPRKHINATKKRVRDEFDGDDEPGFAWITKGRTIESFVPKALLTAVVNEVHPGLDYAPPGSEWDQPLEISKGQVRRSPDKVKIARTVVQRWHQDEFPEDVLANTGRLVSFIKDAN